MRDIVLACACAALAACAGAPAAPGSPEAEQQLYRQKCSGCHRPYEPSSRSRAEWRTVMERMAAKAHLSAEQAGSLRHWLEARASDGEAAR